MNVLDLVVVADLLFNWGAGWRYVFSPSFRRKVRERRKQHPRIYDPISYIVAFAVINGLLIVFLVLVCMWLYRDVVARHVGA